MSTLSTRTWGFHSQFSFFVCYEHSPILVLCMWRETKARNLLLFTPQAFLRERTNYVICTLLLCDWSVQQTTRNPQTQYKGMWFGCEQPFLWGSVVWHPKKWLRRRLPSPRLNRVLWVKGGWVVGRIHWMIWMQVQGSIKDNEGAWFINKLCVALTLHSGCE